MYALIIPICYNFTSFLAATMPRPSSGLTASPTGPSRTCTGQSRPTTARPMTSTSTRHEGSYVIALLEGRGVAREVGMAALDRDIGKVMLVQVRQKRPAHICLSLP